MTTIASGPPGVEVAHMWQPSAVFGDPRPDVTLNDPANPWAVAFRARLRRITGLRSLAEADDQSVENTGRRGLTPLPTVPRGKTLVYEGDVQAKTLDALRVVSETLRSSFGERGQLGTMRLLGAVEWQYTARSLGYDEDDEQTTGPDSRYPFQRSFQLNLRMYDGRYYVAAQQSESRGAGGQATVTNEGTADTDPTFVVDVPADGTTVTFYNDTLGRKVRFVDLSAGELTVNFKTRGAQLPSAARDDVSGKLDTANMDWWHEFVPGLVPGSNVLRVTGGAWTVTWRHASG